MEKLRSMFESLHTGAESRDENNGLRLPQSLEERKVLGKDFVFEGKMWLLINKITIKT